MAAAMNSQPESTPERPMRGAAQWLPRCARAWPFFSYRVCLRLHAIVDHLRGFRVRGRLRRRAVAVGRGPAALAADALQPAENVRRGLRLPGMAEAERAPATEEAYRNCSS